MKKQDTLYSLYQKRKGVTPCDQLNRIGFETDINDGKPPCICCECLTELDITLNFLEKCEKSYQTLTDTYYWSVKLCQDIETDKCNPNVIEPEAIEDNNTCPTESPLEVGEAVADTNGSEARHPAELAALEDARCAQCGSRRRCPHWAPPATHTCPYCQKVFTRKFNFKLHL